MNEDKVKIAMDKLQELIDKKPLNHIKNVDSWLDEIYCDYEQ